MCRYDSYHVISDVRAHDSPLNKQTIATKVKTSKGSKLQQTTNGINPHQLNQCIAFICKP